MGKNLTKKSGISVGLHVILVGAVVGALLWANDEHDSLAESSEADVESLRTEVKEDIKEVNGKLDTLISKQAADTKEILLLLMDIKDGGTP